MISKRSFVQSNMNYEFENEFENYNKNSLDNVEIKKSEPDFKFSPRIKKQSSNNFSNISNINPDQDNLVFQKMMSSKIMINSNNTNNSRISSSSNSSHNVIATDLTIQESQKFLSLSKNNISKFKFYNLVQLLMMIY